jgi:hypothetical protein
MPSPTAQRLLVLRSDLHQTRFVPDADATQPLQEGQARLAVEHFALTANNITYAAFGEAMKYWQFFPAVDAAWGCVPVWGFATVAESRSAGVEVGRRVWGYLPMGTHLVVQPARVGTLGFIEASPHRAELAAVYNQMSFCDTDPAWSAATEGLQAVLRPLFMTGFLIDDFLADNHFFAADQVILSSASSKTAYGTAFCLAQRIASRPRLLGLTSEANLAFTRSLGCYDQVLAYAALPTLAPAVATVYVDFAGSAPLRRNVHEHFNDALRYSSSIGGTHWQALGSGSGLPGPRPTLFFAPAQIKKRSAAPPQGWGSAGLQQRTGQAMAAFMQQVQRPADPWVRIVNRQGPAAVEAAYRALLDGWADAREGVMLSLKN